MSEVIVIGGEQLVLPSCTETELKQKLEKDELWTPEGKIDLALAQAHKSHADEEGFLEGHIFPVAADVLEYLQKRNKDKAAKITMVTGALLHDAVVQHTVDENSFDIAKCADVFGNEVQILLYRLTKYGSDNDIYLSKLSAALTEDPILIKIIARLNKVQNKIVNVASNPDDLAHYIEETDQDFLPIANTLIDKELHIRLRILLDLGRTALNNL